MSGVDVDDMVKPPPSAGTGVHPWLFGQACQLKEIGATPEEARMYIQGKRLTIGAVDGVAGFRRLVADSPSGGREFSDSIDGKIGQARKHRAQIVANW
jgi:hypothetical protein